MADEKFTFEQAKIRLAEIASEARKKDTSLERSLDLLEEGVRLANICTELVDHTDLDARVSVTVPDVPEDTDSPQAGAGTADETAAEGDDDGDGVEEPLGERDDD
jgi:exodeoxyribonuclease VII small subunit